MLNMPCDAAKAGGYQSLGQQQQQLLLVTACNQPIDNASGSRTQGFNPLSGPQGLWPLAKAGGVHLHNVQCTAKACVTETGSIAHI
jgi:hypothetical protein